MSGLLDDLTLDDVKNKNVDSEIDLSSEAKEYHIIQTFYEVQKGKNLLVFALVRFGAYERYDIRYWYDNGSKPGKGLSMTSEEIVKLQDAIESKNYDVISSDKRAEFRGNKVSATLYDRICLLSDYNVKGETWQKEVAVVDWGYGKKIDFRKWTNDYSKCGKGVCLTESEAESIFEIIREIKV